jgi:histidyl-tRNA synthetase
MKINAVKGMNDILPDISYKLLYLEKILQDWLTSYSYKNIRTPIVENTNLFVRSIGEVTDIVEKEMYTFIDSLNGDSLTLRPEGTAGTIRSVVEHNLLYNNTQKLWYIGSMFRHERPQKGRYRQFTQLGVEALGFKSSDIDVEIILMQQDLWQRLGIKDVYLEINCLGNSEERSQHKTALITYLEQNLDILDEDAKRRLHSNPLRILDTKNSNMFELVKNAPTLLDYLGDKSLEHYNSWKQKLQKLNINYRENKNLVRGLDYYNLSVFEWVTNSFGNSMTISAGGRYDPLISDMLGQNNYAIGFAIGIERLMLLLEQQQLLQIREAIDFAILTLGNVSDYAFNIANILRKNGFSVMQNFLDNSLKSQLKKAVNSNSKYAVIIGEDEVANNIIIVKDLIKEQQHQFNSEQFNQFIASLF